MTTATTATGNPGSPTNTNGSAKVKVPRAMTHIEAAGKISKILDLLSASDRKRVLAFVNESSE